MSWRKNLAWIPALALSLWQPAAYSLESEMRTAQTAQAYEEGNYAFENIKEVSKVEKLAESFNRNFNRAIGSTKSDLSWIANTGFRFDAPALETFLREHPSATAQDYLNTLAGSIRVERNGQAFIDGCEDLPDIAEIQSIILGDEQRQTQRVQELSKKYLVLDYLDSAAIAVATNLNWRTHASISKEDLKRIWRAGFVLDDLSKSFGTACVVTSPINTYEAKSDKLKESPEFQSFKRMRTGIPPHEPAPPMNPRPQVVAVREKQDISESILDQARRLGIPLEDLEKDAAFWHQVTDMSKNSVLSGNSTFNVNKDDGHSYHAKLVKEKSRADLECMLSAALSESFDFIPEPMFPLSLEMQGSHLVLIESVEDAHCPLEERIEQVARMHTQGLAQIERYNQGVQETSGEQALTINIAQAPYLLSDEFATKYLSAWNGASPQEAWRTAVERLQSTSARTLTHNDLKEDNMQGKYIVDLESMRIGHPGVDLAYVLIAYDVPQEEWAEHITSYAKRIGVDESDLAQAVDAGKVYCVLREKGGVQYRLATKEVDVQEQERMRAYLERLERYLA